MKTFRLVAVLLVIALLSVAPLRMKNDLSGDPYLMLTAQTEKWGLFRDGDWSSRVYQIYTDGSYEITCEYIGSGQEGGKKPDTYTGVMEPEDFRSLYLACSRDWTAPRINYSDTCDGQAWQLTMFDRNGKVIRTTGNLAYVYGWKTVEKILSLLPR